MPRYNNLNIEPLTPLEAGKRGYILPSEARISHEWIEANFETRHSDVIVYVNGRYRCVAKNTTPLYEIVEKLGL